MKPSGKTSRATIETVVREHYGKLLAALILQYKDIELAEDCLQEAIVKALRSWQCSKLPQNPAGWIMTTAKREAIDRFRRKTNFDTKRTLLLASETSVAAEIDDEEIPDERLRLIFTCCHPALTEPARIALTLKTLCGLSTLQIANAFLIQEKTIAQRLLRAKNKIKLASIAYEIPASSLWKERLASVMSVVYLIFNEGYHSASEIKPIQADLCREAMSIGNTLLQLMPNEAEVIGLQALMYFHYSRFPARLNIQGETVSLSEQNRTLWLDEYIVAADKLLKTGLMKGHPDVYQIQAAISAVHAHAPDYAQTDWKQITLLYQILYQYQPTAVVELNAAVALSFATSPEAGLCAIDSLQAQNVLQNYQPLHAAKADMLSRAGKYESAIRSYEVAIDLASNKADKRWLLRQLQSISESPKKT